MYIYSAHTITNTSLLLVNTRLNNNFQWNPYFDIYNTFFHIEMHVYILSELKA